MATEDEQDVLLSPREQDVITAMRGGDEHRRMRQTVLDIEDTLQMYGQPIMAPLSDSILRLCERHDTMEGLLRECFKVVASRQLADAIETVLKDA